MEQLCKFKRSSPHLCCTSRRFPAEADEKADERSPLCAAMKPTHVAPDNCEPARGEPQWKHQVTPNTLKGTTCDDTLQPTNEQRSQSPANAAATDPSPL